MSEVDSEVALDPEDRKLVTLARAARARTRADEGAAIRDSDGRTYAAATVALSALQLSALQVAVAMAVCSGATGVEAAAIVGDGGHDDGPGVNALHEIGPDVTVFLAAADGTVHARF